MRLPRCIVILLRRSCGAEGLSDITTRWNEISGLLSHPSELLCGGNQSLVLGNCGLAEYHQVGQLTAHNRVNQALSNTEFASQQLDATVRAVKPTPPERTELLLVGHSLGT
jgi:hypothetical protein